MLVYQLIPFNWIINSFYSKFNRIKMPHQYVTLCSYNYTCIEIKQFQTLNSIHPYLNLNIMHFVNPAHNWQNGLLQVWNINQGLLKRISWHRVMLKNDTLPKLPFSTYSSLRVSGLKLKSVTPANLSDNHINTK